MEPGDGIAVDGQPYTFRDKGGLYSQVWHSPGSEPEGKSHGSAAVCLTEGGDVVIGSAGGRHGWEMPGGRPEEGEDWWTTLEREVMEEVCARIEDARLLGFVRSECVSGRESGQVLVRSLWVARVTLLPWRPEQEIKIRRVVPLESALETLEFPAGQLPLWRRWVEEARSAALA